MRGTHFLVRLELDNNSSLGIGKGGVIDQHFLIFFLIWVYI
jgi:hypothetical protein